MLVADKKNIFEPDDISFEERQAQLKQEAKKEAERLKRQKNSPFSRWTQFNNDHTKELIWLALKYPKAHAILLFLIDQMDQYNAVMCSYKVLEEVLSVGHATIARNLKVLKENGFIAILKSGTSNVFTINDDVYWKSWGSNKKYSKFPANVVLALSEQEENYQMSFADLKVTKHKEVKNGEK
jgi:Fe2+ or Zn2+ uptake regulation protein